jgi:hypothetical protein
VHETSKAFLPESQKNAFKWLKLWTRVFARPRKCFLSLDAHALAVTKCRNLLLAVLFIGNRVDLSSKTIDNCDAGSEDHADKSQCHKQDIAKFGNSRLGDSLVMQIWRIDVDQRNTSKRADQSDKPIQIARSQD